MSYEPNRHERCVDGWVKAMKTDRERIDWLQTQTGAELVEFGEYWKFQSNRELIFLKKTIREVIDEAMEYERINNNV
jgi:hypothetical protein